MKILNLYAGIGGNRKLWGDEHEITAVEMDPKIAKIYQDFFPKDKVVVGDAHQYLLDHYNEFDFIWSSPPCPTHSRFNNLFKVQEKKKPRFPDMKLWQEIIFLNYWFEGKWVVENVLSYYKPLIEPFKSGNHYFWSNFIIPEKKTIKRGIRTEKVKEKEEKRGFDLSGLEIPNTFKEKILNNCVFPELGLYVLKWSKRDKIKNLIYER